MSEIELFSKTKTRKFLKKIAKVFFGLDKLPVPLEKMNDTVLTDEFNKLRIKLDKVDKFYSKKKKKSKIIKGGWLPTTAARPAGWSPNVEVTVILRNPISGVADDLDINPHEVSVKDLIDILHTRYPNIPHGNLRLFYNPVGGEVEPLTLRGNTLASYGLDNDGEQYNITWISEEPPPLVEHFPPLIAGINDPPVGHPWGPPLPPMGFAWYDIPLFDPLWDTWYASLPGLQQLVVAGVPAVAGAAAAKTSAAAIRAGVVMIASYIAPNLTPADVIDMIRNVTLTGGHRKKSKRRKKTKRRQKRRRKKTRKHRRRRRRRKTKHRR